jgi:hypothetical protein
MVKKTKINTVDIQKEANKILVECLENYRLSMSMMGGDAPIETLCLDNKTLKCLRAAGFSRLYDLLGRDFTEVKGITETGIRDLTSRLQEFFAIGS